MAKVFTYPWSQFPVDKRISVVLTQELPRVSLVVKVKRPRKTDKTEIKVVGPLSKFANATYAYGSVNLHFNWQGVNQRTRLLLYEEESEITVTLPYEGRETEISVRGIEKNHISYER